MVEKRPEVRGGKNRDPKAEAAARKPGADHVADFHTNADTDAGVGSLHHTLGPANGQASPGGHTHDGSDSAVLWTGVNLTDPTGSSSTSDLAAAITALNALIRSKSSS